MTKITRVLGLMATCALVGGARLEAQGPPPRESAGFINVNVGAQPQRRTIQASQSFSLYDETATVTSNQPIKNGPMFDVSGGYRVRRRLAFAVGLSSFRSRGDGGVTASIPDLHFFDRPRIVTQDTSGLDRSEVGVHLQAVWFVPLSDTIDVSLSAGPSFIRLSQQVATVTVTTGTQDINVLQDSQTGTALGVNIGFDGNLMFTPRFGAGLFARYAGGSTDLPAAADVKVGGLQAGVGLRVRF